MEADILGSTLPWRRGRAAPGPGPRPCVLLGDAGGVYLKSVMDDQRAVGEISIEGIPISGIPDGVYTGGCDVDFIYAKAEAAV